MGVAVPDGILERHHALAERGLEFHVMLADGAGGLGVVERWHRTSPSSGVTLDIYVHRSAKCKRWDRRSSATASWPGSAELGSSRCSADPCVRWASASWQKP